MSTEAGRTGQAPTEPEAEAISTVDPTGRGPVEPAGDTPSPPPARSGRSGPGRARWVRRTTRIAQVLAPGVVFVLVWQLAAGELINPLYVSQPTAIAERLATLAASEAFYTDLWVTFRELAIGYTTGFLTGTLAGYALGRSATMARIFQPYIMAFYGIPKIALAPLFIIWFGIGIWSKVVLAAIMVFFLVFFNVFMGVLNVDRNLVDLARLMGANQRQLTRHVYLKAAMPYIIMGMRAALPYSVIGVIVGEFTAAREGLGLYMLRSSSTFDPAGVFAGIVVLLAFIVLANAALGRLEARLLKWKPAEELSGTTP